MCQYDISRDKVASASGSWRGWQQNPAMGAPNSSRQQQATGWQHSTVAGQDAGCRTMNMDMVLCDLLARVIVRLRGMWQHVVRGRRAPPDHQQWVHARTHANRTQVGRRKSGENGQYSYPQCYTGQT